MWNDEFFDSTIAMNIHIIHDDYTSWDRKETA